MRDRLIELIINADTYDSYECKLCNKDDDACDCCYAEKLADKLLANGVVCLPCKVGDKTFLLLEKISGGYDIIESKCMKIVDNGYGKNFSMFFDCVEIGNTMEFDIYDFGKTVFLTREEAEQKYGR